MSVNIIACLLAAGFFGCLTMLDLTSGIPSQEKLGHENEGPVHDEVSGPDVYKVAVLLSAAAAVLSLFLFS